MNPNINVPNTLTVLRVASLPFFIWFLYQKEQAYHIAALVLFSIASLTDFVDGYLARKWKQETEFGKFLDPLADKIIVVGCFTTFIFLHEQIELWMVLLIIGRDMLITTLRYLAIRSGKSIRTTMLGKVKTAFQMGAIILILVFFILVSSSKRILINEVYQQGKVAGMTVFGIASENAVGFIRAWKENGAPGWNDLIFGLGGFVPYFGMLLTTIITVVSGIRYLVSNREVIRIDSIRRALGKNGN
ncbi:CDP-diacylglycerol--glycerol-3-phosphate 3-phosphatidyltransferase [Leptospira wolffii]|uniref:CDP-diacylglycerol--glycerol-3-phosphate 3-phosphatidyltransferase n=1 Tax=Leptospira wolffii TaxID=409998 RepID=A0ABV5BLK0_9LEPT|nr:CDP-diacylglycerol--glycerol-3-phosphate 3-phosphatidyltransferase [Leptospira wolffii]EPG68163.1 CDP-diacylglycerol--glycerol-3-phosphate 3-phosphatidyltransferase [Leptospira wolffii serovar Khorat str. Khorat-H2]TGK60262.1 CDP-diacylglycerol--glycerol-3-phosphate 3-phosphatidyltransferase [Leptospira wolffii]TGK72604.1 CDP-diacylglycerol--glycerol-3-phosphate 3-phosphatidyltransferase [Leptospira wolffii]TGK76269.1 CDP-diacylglycerol--glycerol-3-phosphate 3-phosphatidyltransferase [Leptos